LWLNGWNDMGLTTHEWLVAYVLDYDVVTKPRHKTQDVLLWNIIKEKKPMNLFQITKGHIQTLLQKITIYMVLPY
jgi:hypothetical protein